MKDEAIVAKVREIVGQHKLPDFIVGFDVRPGDIDGDPAIWVVFKTAHGPNEWGAEAERQVTAVRSLQDTLMPELLDAFEDRFPYFRYEAARSLHPVSA